MNLQARYDLICVKSAVKIQPTNVVTSCELLIAACYSVTVLCCYL